MESINDKPLAQFWKEAAQNQKGKKLGFQMPGFDQWVKDVQAMPAEKQVEAVSKKLKELNPEFDGNLTGNYMNGTPKIENGIVTELGLITHKVSDLSPLRAFAGLKILICNNSHGQGLSDLSDLAPLQGLKLITLFCPISQISDLSPLADMPLTYLNCSSTQIRSLSPLGGLPLKTLVCDFHPESDTELLRSIKTLESINDKPLTQFWKDAAQNQKGKKLGFQMPGFDQWMATVANLRPEQQMEAVSKKMKELNPGFDGNITHKIEAGAVTELKFCTDQVTDISPVRVFTKLKLAEFVGGHWSRRNRFSDLSPLQGLPITHLECWGSSVTDLSPLRGMPLNYLSCGHSLVSDLGPTVGMPLNYLNCNASNISDLSPLENCKTLRELLMSGAPVTDLSPLKGKELTTIHFVPFKNTKGIEAIREMKTLSLIGFSGDPNDQYRPDEFWKRYDAREFDRFTSITVDLGKWVEHVRKLPVEQQLDVVSKKLVELNPGFDGKLTGLFNQGTPKIEKEAVTELQLVSDNVTDISPLAVLSGLKVLFVNGSGPGKGRLSELGPLQGIKLTNLDCGSTPVQSLSPLKGMPLKRLVCSGTQVADLSPLAGMDLTEVYVTPKNIAKGMELMRQMKTLKTIGVAANDKWTVEEFWKLYDAGEFGKPAPSSKPLAFQTPGFDLWVKEVQAMPAEKQVEAVLKKLVDLNPGFDGKVTVGTANGATKIEDGVVTEFAIFTDHVTDISPVRAFPGLQDLCCSGSRILDLSGRLTDLRPLQGMQLKMFGCFGNPLSDLSPLRGVPLKTLHCDATSVADLSPLKGSSLTKLTICGTEVSDLEPLRGSRLKTLIIYTKRITDLSPLKNLPLEELDFRSSGVTDLSTLKSLPLTTLWCDLKPELDLDVLRSINTLKTINDQPAVDVLKR